MRKIPTFTFGLLSVSALCDHSFCQRGLSSPWGVLLLRVSWPVRRLPVLMCLLPLGGSPKWLSPRWSLRKLWCLGSWSGLSCVAPDRERGSLRHFLLLHYLHFPRSQAELGRLEPVRMNGPSCSHLLSPTARTIRGATFI